MFSKQTKRWLRAIGIAKVLFEEEGYHCIYLKEIEEFIKEVVSLNQRRLYQLVKSLIFRRKMSGTVEILEDEIRIFLFKEGKEEIISGRLRISIKENGQLEVQELPFLNFNQMELPFDSEPTKAIKGGEE